MVKGFWNTFNQVEMVEIENQNWFFGKKIAMELKEIVILSPFGRIFQISKAPFNQEN